MQKLIKVYGLPNFKSNMDYFQSLLKYIVFQQLNWKAANTIHQRLINLSPNNKVTPQRIVKLKNEEMVQVGLSFQKIDYIKNLADFFSNNIFDCNTVRKMSDKEISAKLIEIKGIGQWTVDMFLIFSLMREDVFPSGDLAIQKGFCILNDLDSKPSIDEINESSKLWKPYRTIASWYLWKLIDGQTEW